MKIIKKIFPALFITLVTIAISQTLFATVMRKEKAQCWQELSTTAQTVSREITTKFNDELIKLHLIENIMLDDGVFSVDEIDLLHIDSIQPTTFFSRIDVLYPDNTLVTNGTEIRLAEQIDFHEVAKKGEYMSRRRTDFVTGRECVYYVLPIVQEDQVFAVLIACIDSRNLAEIFKPLTYNGQANICIIDMDDGNFVMDSWHQELGNAYDMAERKKLPGYENVDLIQALQNRETGMAAFESESIGDGIYMYFMPMEIFDWQLSVFAPSRVLFRDIDELKGYFWMAGLTEVILLIMYFCWNILTVRQLEKSNLEIEKQRLQLRFLSYRDQLTGLYNRTKFEEDRQELRKAVVPKLGVAFIDVNGLKSLNDSQSHDSGDAYLRRTARVLTEVFPQGAYRIGGDEFVILAPGVDQECFRNAMTALLEHMEASQVSASAGYQWGADCADPDILLKQAETRMYQVKEAHYAALGIRR